MDFTTKLEQALSLAEDDNSRAMIKAALSNMLDQVGLLVAADAIEEMGDDAAQRLGGLVRQAVSGNDPDRYEHTMRRMSLGLFQELDEVAKITGYRNHHGYIFQLKGTRTSMDLTVTPKRLMGTVSYPDATGKQKKDVSMDVDEIMGWFPADVQDQVLTLILLASLDDAARQSHQLDMSGEHDYTARRIASYAREIWQLAHSIFTREEDEAFPEVEEFTRQISKTLQRMESALVDQEPEVAKVVVLQLDKVLKDLTATFNETPAMTRVFRLISMSLGRMPKGWK